MYQTIYLDYLLIMKTAKKKTITKNINHKRILSDWLHSAICTFVFVFYWPVIIQICSNNNKKIVVVSIFQGVLIKD